MSTRKQRSQGKERFWRALLGRWRGSGLSVRAFCREQGLSEPSFYAWRRTLLARDAGAERPVAERPVTRDGAAVRFVPVHLAPESTSETACKSTSLTPSATTSKSAAVEDGASALELIVAGGRRLRVGPGFDGPTLRRLLALLEEGGS